MQILDIVLLTCFIPGIVQGITKGFVRQVTGLLALVAGVFAGHRFSLDLAERLTDLVKMDPHTLRIMLFVLIAIITVLIVNLLGELITRVVKISLMGWVNVVLGILFGIIRTAFFLSLMILLFEGLNGVFHFVAAEKMGDATIYCALKNVGETVFPYLKSLFGHA